MVAAMRRWGVSVIVAGNVVGVSGHYWTRWSANRAAARLTAGAPEGVRYRVVGRSSQPWADWGPDRGGDGVGELASRWHNRLESAFIAVGALRYRMQTT